MAGYKDAKTSSSVATIKVTFDAATPYFDEGDREYTFTKGTKQIIMDMANVDDEGVLTYEWYKMAGDTPNTSTDNPVTSKDSTKGILEINTPATDGDEETYYAVATNSNDKANGNITAKSDPSPMHIITATDAVKFEITFDPQTGDDPITLMTGFNGRLEELPGVARGGYIFEGWFTEKSGGAKITLDTYKVVEKEDETAEIEYEVDVPGYVFDGPTTVYAQWTKKSSGSGGTVVDSETPDPGDGSQQAELPFIDVKKADWFYDNVAYVYHNGLMVGTTHNLFSPQMSTTRGMIVTILHRLEGTPAASADNPFTDVASDTWYTDAVIWAAENAIVEGYGNGKFGPSDLLTREQLVTILYNYSKFKGYDITADQDLNKFSDEATISGYAKTAMQWAVKHGIVTGIGEDLLSSTTTATRAQIAAILQRYIEAFVK